MSETVVVTESYAELKVEQPLKARTRVVKIEILITLVIRNM